MKPSLKYAMIGIALASVYASLTAENNPTTKEKPATQADQKTLPGPRHIRVQVEYINMPLLTMSALLDDDKATETDVILRARVAELIKAGKAHHVATQMLIARSGKKATTGSMREYIYPTEYEPPQLPKIVQTAADDIKIERYDRNLAIGPTPTAFETRHLGSMLEVEPTIDDDSKYIDLRIEPEMVFHTKNTVYATWKDERGTADITMPEFYVMRFFTTITVMNGKPALVGVLSPKNEQGHTDYSRKLLVFVKANIININTP